MSLIKQLEEQSKVLEEGKGKAKKKIKKAKAKALAALQSTSDPVAKNAIHKSGAGRHTSAKDYKRKEKHPGQLDENEVTPYQTPTEEPKPEEEEVKTEETPEEEVKVEEEETDATPSADINAVQMFFESRDQTHLWHLQTSSYAEHITLNDYYDALLPLVDAFIEGLQGLTGERSSGPITIQLTDYCDGCAVKHLNELKDSIDVIYESVSSFTSLTNILDDILSLIDKTLYLLTLK